MGYVASAVIPGLTLAAGLVLGALVAPPDAVAAVAVGRDAGMPRRVFTILEGEACSTPPSSTARAAGGIRTRRTG